MAVAVAVYPRFLRHYPKSGVTTPPPWVSELVGVADGVWEQFDSALSVQSTQSSEFVLTSVRVANAVSMGRAEFASRTTQAYGLIFGSLDLHENMRLVRVWNFIPWLLNELEDLPQRYFAFNFGRFAAYERAYDSRESFSRLVSTATGIGNFGSDLLVYGLSSSCPSFPVENPRQVPSYQYSGKFGPLPPCFARATRVDFGHSQRLLVGGTASIRGEDTRHEGDVKAQIDETLINLATLVAAGDGSSISSEPSEIERQSFLKKFEHVRIYHRRREDAQVVENHLASEFPGAKTIEISIADLCRPPLLVEVEGTAEL